MAVGPAGGVFESEEEVFAGDDEDVPFLEALIEFLRADGEAGEPEPEEEGAFAGVDAPGDVVSEAFERAFARDAAFFPVVGHDDVAAEAEDFAGFDERADDLLAGAGIGESDDGAHGADGAG